MLYAAEHCVLHINDLMAFTATITHSAVRNARRCRTAWGYVCVMWRDVNQPSSSTNAICVHFECVSACVFTFRPKQQFNDDKYCARIIQVNPLNGSNCRLLCIQHFEMWRTPSSAATLPLPPIRRHCENTCVHTYNRYIRCVCVARCSKIENCVWHSEIDVCSALHMFVRIHLRRYICKMHFGT